MACLMENKTWPALKSCNRKSCETSADELHDRLSELPDDIVVSILSYLNLKEAARTTLLSHHWVHHWRNLPILNFEDSVTMEKIKDNDADELICQERSNFVTWVDHIVERYLAPAIDEFTVSFDLDNSCQSHIDKWVVFALEKQVKSLELNFRQASIFYLTDSKHNRYSLSLERPIGLELSSNLASKSSLKKLCLRNVNVTTEVIECLLRSCSLLEDLCIESSKYLTSVRASGVSLPLKHLEISCCRYIEVIDICSPKLLSFKYLGRPLVLHIANASSLSEVWIGGFKDDPVAYAFDSLSKYFQQQLEYLALKMCFYSEQNLGINCCPELKKLKHLELRVAGKCYHTLLGWIPLIQACPVLQKLTLRLFSYYRPYSKELVKPDGRPLKCLKTLEVFGFVGCQIDLDLVNFVLEKGIMLEEVFIGLDSYSYKEDPEDSRTRAMRLKQKLPPSAKLIVEKASMQMIY